MMVSTQCKVQMMYYTFVHLKLIGCCITNVSPINLIGKKEFLQGMSFFSRVSPQFFPLSFSQSENSQQENRDISHTSLESDLSLAESPDEDAVS